MNSFKLKTSYINAISTLSLEEKGLLLEEIFAYTADMPLYREKELPAAVQVAFGFIKDGIDEEKHKDSLRCAKNRESAKKRWTATSAERTIREELQEKYANVCERMQTHNTECERMQTHNTECERMQTHNTECERMQTHNTECERMQTHNTECERILQKEEKNASPLTIPQQENNKNIYTPCSRVKTLYAPLDDFDGSPVAKQSDIEPALPLVDKLNVGADDKQIFYSGFSANGLTSKAKNDGGRDAESMPEGVASGATIQVSVPEGVAKTPPKKKAFVPPTLPEVQEYVKERGLMIDPAAFFDYFTEGEWKDSEGKPVKNWKQKALTWDCSARTRRTLDAARHLLPKKSAVKSQTYSEEIPL